MQPERVDTARPILTPEGARLTLRVAGPGVRALAWVIDLMIRLGAYFAAAIVLGFAGAVGQSAFMILLFAGEWLYFALFEGLSGATPGKRRMGLLVVQRDGAPCGLEASFVRNLVRFADMLPPLYGFGFASVVASPDFQRLGDRAAGTLVVYHERWARGSAGVIHARRDPKRSDAGRSETGHGEDRIEPVPPAAALTGEEAAALLDFAKRARDWGVERQREVTDRLEPLTGLTGEAGRKRVWAHVRWLETQAG